jgi:hypothetical protein
VCAGLDLHPRRTLFVKLRLLDQDDSSLLGQSRQKMLRALENEVPTQVTEHNKVGLAQHEPPPAGVNWREENEECPEPQRFEDRSVGADASSTFYAAKRKSCAA